MAMSMSMHFSPPSPPSRNPTYRIRAKPANGYPPESPIVDRAAASGARIPQIGEKVAANGAHIPQIGEKAAALDAGLGLGVLYDDGYGTASVQDYFEAARDIIQHDGGGPPTWFCPVECGRPVKDAPLLLFLPGADGVGMGLILHHKSLGKVFEVRCLHIPVNDRTPFEGLLKFVGDILKYEHSMYPNKPIYLVGDSFGGCLALALAAHNPNIDLVLVLVNPATSFDKSQVQLLLPALETLPSELYTTVPYLMSFIMGDPVKMALTTVGDGLPLQQTLDELSKSLVSLLPRLSDLADIIPRETLLWKLKLLKSAASYVNSRLHAVEAEVLLLASGKDNLLPSGTEAERLHASLKKSRICYFKDNGHTLLLEDGINLLTVIKGTGFYRRSSKYDFVEDYLPPSKAEFIRTFEQDDKWFHLLTSPVMLSTLGNGRIVRGLAGVPDKGPVLLVGYHMLLGMELNPLYEAFLREKKIIIRGLAHPTLFAGKSKKLKEFSRFDIVTLFGALPVSAKDMYRLFSRKSFVLLYPGGAREALHRKGEEYKLFWPDQPEFVRMAAKFEVTIVPFGVVGEDDIVELVADYNDLISNPLTRRFIEEFNQDAITLRADAGGEVANQQWLFLPGMLPKLPGRFYYLFGKPIETRGMKGILKDRKNANDLYLQIKSEVEDIMSYLKRKREEDPYRGILQRALYQNSWGSTPEVPTFDP